MPITTVLTPRSHAFDRTNHPDAVAAGGPLPLLAFSLTGLLAELLALLCSGGGACSMIISFVLIAGAPALAAAVALGVAETMPTWPLQNSRHSLQSYNRDVDAAKKQRGSGEHQVTLDADLEQN